MDIYRARDNSDGPILTTFLKNFLSVTILQNKKKTKNTMTISHFSKTVSRILITLCNGFESFRFPQKLHLSYFWENFGSDIKVKKGLKGFKIKIFCFFIYINYTFLNKK